MNDQVSNPAFRESRKSTRVPLKVVISVEDSADNLTCDGETVLVNLQGALLSTEIGLILGMRIVIEVYLTGKRARARVVYVDAGNPLLCGIELDWAQNIWGVSFPPDDWVEASAPAS